MSIFLNFICLECDNSDCDRTGITCMLCNPNIDDKGICLDFTNKNLLCVPPSDDGGGVLPGRTEVEPAYL